MTNSLPTLSVCSITLNEINNIKNMLENIKDIADEIVIVDEYSTDGTRDILKEYNVRIIDGRLDNNWAFIRNTAVSNATKDWILIIDADEILDPLLHHVLHTKGLLTYCDSAGFDAIVCSRKNYLDDIFQISTYPDRTIRLFRNNRVIKYDGYIHEQPSNYIKRFESQYHIIHKKTWKKQKEQDIRYIEMTKHLRG